MVDIGINAWSSLFDNLKINIILQDYLIIINIFLKPETGPNKEETY